VSGDIGFAGQSLSHLGVLYVGEAEYLDVVTGFVDEGLSGGEPVMVAVPGAKVDLIRASLHRRGAHFVDMAELGRNPGRIIPALHEFLHDNGASSCRFVSETIWAGRTTAEVAEAVRHEALMNVAFADSPLSVLCAYDCHAVPADVIGRSWQIHPVVIQDRHRRVSAHYGDPAAVYADDLWPLPPLPRGSEVLVFSSDTDLTKLRSWVQRFGWAADLPIDRVDDLVLAVSEVASNSIRHGGGKGSLTMWDGSEGAVQAEVGDAGCISDPLVGRYPPGPDADVSGLWLVNQLCDLVEIRTGPGGTRVRLTVSS
jgi:anti-sigma regulatory factor (Ser/Thr protein kinase)